MDWSRVFEGLFAQADAFHDRVQARRAARWPSRRPACVVPDVGFGTPQRLLLGGRVLRGERLLPARAMDTPLRNLLHFYRHLATDEVPGARLRLRFGGREQEAVADEEGYFQAEIVPDGPPLAPGWHAVDVELLDPEPFGPAAQAQVLLPPGGARFGIISDIDDTVVQTHTARRARMLLTLARSNAHTRKPFEGVAAFYRALQAGAGGAEDNPVFYVSSSPWNLYAPLVEYLDVQGIPPGPLLLRDFGDHTLFASREHHAHKLASIERILEVYPRLPFVLIGDSSEQDPEIYSEVVRRHPGRVWAVYIRLVEADEARLAAIDRLVERVRASGAQLVLAPDSAFAAAHAAAEGLIATGRLAQVRQEKREDEAGPVPEEIPARPVQGIDAT